MHAIPEYPYRDTGKDSRSAGRKGRNGGGSRPYAHRRRSTRSQAAVQPGPAMVLRRFWDEHALKTGITLFWLWFAAANWPGLQ